MMMMMQGESTPFAYGSGGVHKTPLHTQPIHYSAFSPQRRSGKIGLDFASSSSFTTSPSSCNQESNAIATEKRLYLARLTLEYQELVDRYRLCLSHLEDAAKEAEVLRQENMKLRLANSDLTERLRILTQTSQRYHHLPSSSSRLPALSMINDFRNLCVGENGWNANRSVARHEVPVMCPVTVHGNDRFEKKSTERVALPKSISIRSSGYLKMNQPPGGPTSGAHLTNQAPLPRVCVPAGVVGNKEEEGPLEMDVYNQGMMKTELCNKWQETGDCPYGDQCQYAHGVAELRPIIRHPRYKTEICRMMLSGGNCPYGHRCHFRHALTEEERFMRSAGV